MSDMEDAERRLAESLRQIPQEQAVALVCGAIAIAFGDAGLATLGREVKTHLGEEAALERGLR